jgi:hypothetical protein
LFKKEEGRRSPPAHSLPIPELDCSRNYRASHGPSVEALKMAVFLNWILSPETLFLWVVIFSIFGKNFSSSPFFLDVHSWPAPLL